MGRSLEQGLLAAYTAPREGESERAQPAPYRRVALICCHGDPWRSRSALHDGVGWCQEIDVFSEFFPSAFLSIVDSCEEVFDALAKRRICGAKINDLLLASLQTIGSGDRIGKGHHLSAYRDMVRRLLSLVE